MVLIAVSLDVQRIEKFVVHEPELAITNDLYGAFMKFM